MPHSTTLSFPIFGPQLVLCFFATILFSATTLAAPVKVAFIGDQGVGSDSQAVLSLVASEGSDLLLIQGDLGYADNTASTWENHLNTILGVNFPVLTLVGNHENYEWPSYQRLIQQRINRVNGLDCSGDTGVKAKCSFANIEVVQVAPAIYEVPGINAEDRYADFIRSSFSSKSNRWRICSWHKPHRMMQTGEKTGPDWDVYDACLDAGAMVANAHEHAYSRTFLLSDFRNQTVVHRGDQMALRSGQSFAFVSGLGGREVRGQSRGGDWFASIYTADQGATHGALFCTFEDRAASCYFKAIDGAVPDQFSLTRQDESVQAIPSTPGATPTADPTSSATAAAGGNDTGYVFSRTDKVEYRWINTGADGRMGSIWIDQDCATRLGGTSASGDWNDLMERAPGFDAIDNPCSAGSLSAESTVSDAFSVESAPDVDVSGYVFSRSDKQEFRWIESNAAGDSGSVWIDSVCAEHLGGPTVSGDWNELMELAPGFDTITYPCHGI